MRKIRCYECGKSYDFDIDDFCPKCGAFNQPRERAGGAVLRAEGLNEKNHAGSFIHQEFHTENRVRKAVGLSKGVRRTAVGKAQQPLSRRQEMSGGQGKQKNPVQYIFWIIAAIIFFNVMSSILGVLFW